MAGFSFFNSDHERPLSFVPRSVLFSLVLFFTIQVAWHAKQPARLAVASALPSSPPVEKIKILDLGDSITLAKLVMLWLQAFDNQPGISLSYSDLDYSRLIDWLELIILLDQRTSYPLFAASRLYSEVPDEMKKRQILEFVYQQFLLDPNQRWPAMAHAVYVAKHRLKDLDLALRYARALSTNVTVNNVPFWVKQMNIYVLEDMGEIESARVLIGGLLASGTITDEHEIMFLQQRLDQLEQENAAVNQK